MNNEEILHEGSFEDQLIMSLGKAIMEQEMKPSILDFNRMAQIMWSYRVIREHLLEEEMELSYSLHDCFARVGTITIESVEMWFCSAAWFCMALSFTSNVEIYPLVNGKVRMTISYYESTKTIY